MRPGCPYARGGAYPVFQQPRHAANGGQVSSMHPCWAGDHGVARWPIHWRQHGAGYQHPWREGSEHVLQDARHQPNTNRVSCVVAQPSRVAETSANEACGRRMVYNGHFQKGSDFDKSTRRQQTCLNAAFSQDWRFFAPGNEAQASLPTGSRPASSEGANANVKPDARPNFSKECQQVTSSQDAVNCGQRQIPPVSRGAPTTASCQPIADSSDVEARLPVDRTQDSSATKIFPQITGKLGHPHSDNEWSSGHSDVELTLKSQGMGGPPTDGDGDKTLVSCNDSSRGKGDLKSGMTMLQYSLAALKGIMSSLENTETIVESDSLSKNHTTAVIHLFTTTEYSKTTANVATCTQSGDKSPAVRTVSRMTVIKSLGEMDQVPGVSQANTPPAGNEKKGIQSHRNHSEVLRTPIYQDISDDEDTPQLLTNQPTTELKKLSFPPASEDPQYEDISEDESPQFEMPSVPKPNDKQTNKQTSVLCSSSSDLEDGDKTDNQSDDDYIVMDISIADLKFEPEGGAQDIPVEVVLDDNETGGRERNPIHCDLRCPAKKNIPAPVSSQLEVFDTIQNFVQAKTLQFGMNFDIKSTPSSPKYDMYSPDRRETSSDTEDGSETDDSCDYPSESEGNFLTVSKQLLQKGTSLERDNCVPEKENECNEATNVQTGQTKCSGKLTCMQNLRKLLEANCSKHVQLKTNRQKVSQSEDVIVIDSDTEDESDQNPLDSEDPTTQEELRKNSPSTGSPSPPRQSETVIILDSDSEDEDDQNCNKASMMRPSSSVLPCIQVKERSPVVGDGGCGTTGGKLERGTRLPCADSSALQVQPEPRGRQLKEAGQSGSARNNGRPVESDAVHAHGKTDSQATSRKRRVSHKSDAAVKKDEKRVRPSVSKDTVATQNAPSGETASNLFGNTSKKPKGTTPRSQPLPSPPPQKKKPQSAEKGADSTSHPSFGPRLFVERPPQPGVHVKLPEEVHSNGNTASREKNPKQLHRDKRGKFTHKPKPTNNRPRATLHAKEPKPGPLSRRHSSPHPERPSTSGGTWTSTSPPLPSTSRNPASSSDLPQFGEPAGLSETTQSTPVPGNHLPSSKRRHSHFSRNPSLLATPHPPTRTEGQLSSKSAQSSVKEQVKSDWNKSFVPTRRDRKAAMAAEEAARKENDKAKKEVRREARKEARREARKKARREARLGSSHCDRAPRQRSHASEPATPLMKKTKFEAMAYTRGKNREVIRSECSVGEGYKWAEKPRVPRQMRGYIREWKANRSPRRPRQ